jgi:hypothetical protein
MEWMVWPPRIKEIMESDSDPRLETLDGAKTQASTMPSMRKFHIRFH